MQLLSLFNPPPVRLGLWYLGLILLVGVLCFTGYVILPTYEIWTLSRLLNVYFLFKVIVLAGLAYVFLEYLMAVSVRPNKLMLLVFMGTPFMMFASSVTRQAGVNIHATYLLAGGLVLPMVLSIFFAVPALIRQYAFYRWLSVFTGIVLLYFFVYKTPYVAPVDVDMAAKGLEGNASLNALTCFDVVFQFTACGVVLCAFRKVNDVDGWLIRFNHWLCGFVLLASWIPLGLFLTLDWFGHLLEGIYRFSGIYNHPNNNSLFMGMMGLYLLGMFLAEWPLGRRRWYWLLGCVSAFVASLFSLAKASLIPMVVFAVALILLYALLFQPSIKRVLGMLMLLLGLGGLVAGLVYVMTGGTWFDKLSERLESTDSLDWRIRLWTRMIQDLDIKTLLIGNGLSSSTQKVYAILFGDESTRFASFEAHNLFLKNIYEFGLLGLTQIMAMVSFFWQELVAFSHQLFVDRRVLFLMCVQFLLTSYFVLFLMFNVAPLMIAVTYWMMSVVLYLVICHDMAKRPVTQSGEEIAS